MPDKEEFENKVEWPPPKDDPREEVADAHDSKESGDSIA